MTVREVLNELKWRPERDLARAELWIADRRAGTRVLSGADVEELGRSSLRTARATIPYYKVVRIVYEGTVLFSRQEEPEKAFRGGPPPPPRP